MLHLWVEEEASFYQSMCYILCNYFLINYLYSVHTNPLHTQFFTRNLMNVVSSPNYDDILFSYLLWYPCERRRENHLISRCATSYVNIFQLIVYVTCKKIILKELHKESNESGIIYRLWWNLLFFLCLVFWCFMMSSWEQETSC